MVLIGLSILIAGISFLCYRNLPLAWSAHAWPGWRTTPSNEKSSINTIGSVAEGKSQLAYGKEFKNEADLDREDMPPPPSVSRLSASTVRSSEIQGGRYSSVIPVVPTTALDNMISISPTSASITPFPVQNSNQRTYGGRGPPRTSLMHQLQAPLRSTDFQSSSTPRGLVPIRSVASSISSLAIPPTHSSIPAKPRKKVTLLPGHSPLDWAHVSTSVDANLRGLPPSTPYLRVPPSLLRQHIGRKGKNAWTVLGGKVYNITPYIPYHPGGELELLKAAGRDGSKLFGEVHPWVNWEVMLQPCLVGIAIGNEEFAIQGGLEDTD